MCDLFKTSHCELKSQLERQDSNLPTFQTLYSHIAPPTELRSNCKATTTLLVNYVRLFINNNIRQFIINHYRFFDTQQFFYSFRKLFRIFQFIKHCLFHLKHLVVKYSINGDVRNRTEKIHRRENHFTPVTAKTRPKPRK